LCFCLLFLLVLLWFGFHFFVWAFVWFLGSNNPTLSLLQFHPREKSFRRLTRTYVFFFFFLLLVLLFLSYCFFFFFCSLAIPFLTF
jgi:hypothetical protein